MDPLPMSQTPPQPIYSVQVELEARALHVRVLARDRVAFTQLAETTLEYVVLGVQKKFPKADEHDIYTAVHDTLMKYQSNPAIYDPNRGPLIGFFIMAARRDYQNLIAKEDRHAKKTVSFETFVADPDSDAEIEIEFPGGIDAAEQVLRNLRNGEIDANIARLFPDLQDWAILYLMMLRVRDTEMYALDMGIEDVSVEEKRQMVKRAKDRVRAFCLRHKSELLREATAGSHD